MLCYSILDFIFPTWWSCWSSRIRRGRSDWSRRTGGVGASWRLGRRGCSTDSFTVGYNDPLLWVTGGGRVSAGPGDQIQQQIKLWIVIINQNNFAANAVQTEKHLKEELEFIWIRIALSAILWQQLQFFRSEKKFQNLFPTCPFCLAFPFGTEAEINNKNDKAEKLHIKMWKIWFVIKMLHIYTMTKSSQTHSAENDRWSKTRPQ